MCFLYWGLKLRPVDGSQDERDREKESERDLWSGLKTFSCDVAGQPRQTDLSSTEVCLVVSLL